MTYSRVNASSATGTKNLFSSTSPFSGMCSTCIDGCLGLCEIGKSAYRGAEVIYPAPYGDITAASEKDYPVDYSHLNIMGTAFGAHGIEEDSDKVLLIHGDPMTDDTKLILAKNRQGEGDIFTTYRFKRHFTKFVPKP